MELGAHIRMLRGEQKLSLRKLAARAGISPGMLSQIENGKAEPSISSLRKLAIALDIPVFQLMMEEAPRQANLVRKDERKVVAFGHKSLQYEVIQSDPGKKMGLMIGTLEPLSSTAEELLKHQGEECILILEGGMTVETEHETIELGPADSLYFDSSVPHRLINPHRLVCRYLIAMTPPKF